MSSSDDDDIPLSARTGSFTNGTTATSTNGSSKRALSDSEDEDVPLNFKRKALVVAEDSDDEDTPLTQRATNVATETVKPNDTNGASRKRSTTPKKPSSAPAPKKAKKDVKEKKTTKKPTATKVEKATVKKESNGAVKKESNGAVKKESNGAVKKESNGSANVKANGNAKANGKVKRETSVEEEDEDEDEDQFKWWENVEDRTEKWQSLEHNGVMFPPAYEPLPKGVHLLYENKPVQMDPDAEEVAGFFGAMLNSENHTNNPTFCKNFFTDFKQALKETGGAKISGKVVELESFEKCNFTKIFEYYDAQREAKKALPASEKKLLKAEKEELEKPFKFCKIDGREEPVGNFRIEPPGLFRGRGEHPKTGMLKRRVKPSQVTINISKDVPVPKPPYGEWGTVQHDNTVVWLASWKENINGNNKYVLLGNSSSLKGQSDYKKFEKARNLKGVIDRIRQDYRRDLSAKEMIARQRATATYLIDVLALRAGGEKGDDEADTVGCCSLRYEHVTLTKPNIVTFDFLGKDSIRFHQEVKVDVQVFRNLKIFKKPPKTIGDDIFDRLDPSILNKHFQSYMPGLTAKVFRTYNASHTMQQQLDSIKNEGTVAEKVLKFNAANREVAILCNHQRTVTKGHESSMEKYASSIREMQWQKWRLKKMILVIDPKEKKKDPKFFEELEDFTKDEIAEIHEAILEREKVKIEKKFARDNQKLVENKEKPMPEKDLKEALKKVNEMKKEYAAELKSGKPEVKGTVTVEKLRAQIEKLVDRINAKQLQMQDKSDNSTVALGTSKTNYIDPRLTVMFSKKFDVPIEKLFTKTLREKFNWALQSADENWRF